MSDEYQPRSSERLVEILRALDQNPRSWQQEAAETIEALTDALELRKNMMDRAAYVIKQHARSAAYAFECASGILQETDGVYQQLAATFEIDRKNKYRRCGHRWHKHSRNRLARKTFQKALVRLMSSRHLLKSCSMMMRVFGIGFSKSGKTTDPIC